MLYKAKVTVCSEIHTKHVKWHTQEHPLRSKVLSVLLYFCAWGKEFMELYRCLIVYLCGDYCMRYPYFQEFTPVIGQTMTCLWASVPCVG